jgi:hypothetical protein
MGPAPVRIGEIGFERTLEVSLVGGLAVLLESVQAQQTVAGNPRQRQPADSPKGLTLQNR